MVVEKKYDNDEQIFRSDTNPVPEPEKVEC